MRVDVIRAARIQLQKHNAFFAPGALARAGQIIGHCGRDFVGEIHYRRRDFVRHRQGECFKQARHAVFYMHAVIVIHGHRQKTFGNVFKSVRIVVILPNQRVAGTVKIKHFFKVRVFGKQFAHQGRIVAVKLGTDVSIKWQIFVFLLEGGQHRRGVQIIANAHKKDKRHTLYLRVGLQGFGQIVIHVFVPVERAANAVPGFSKRQRFVHGFARLVFFVKAVPNGGVSVNKKENLVPQPAQRFVRYAQRAGRINQVFYMHR